MKRLARWRPQLTRISRMPQSGDTIVEVLIALLIITSVLVGAFLVAQKSAAAVQDSKERGEALQILQGQVEAVRALALKQSDQTAGIYAGSPKYFCINTSNAQQPLPDTVAGSNLNTDNFNNYSGCQFGIGSRYNIAAWYNPAPTGNETFSFLARWDNAQGHRSQEQLNYRVFPGIIVPPPPTIPPCSPSQIVLALDISDSLGANFAPGKTRRQELVQVTQSFINGAGISPTGNEAAIVTFAGYLEGHSHQAGYTPFSEILQPMTTNESTLTTQLQNNLPNHFGTTYIPPLNDTESAWDNSSTRRKILVFVSDGENWEDQTKHGGLGNDAVYAITNNMKDNEGVTIFTISVGTDSNFETLKGMATPGDFSPGDNASLLEFEFQNLANELNCGS